MLKMSRLTEYAFMVIMALKKSDSPASADSLAKKIGLETPTVSKILKLLKNAGLLESKRGANGGYVLVKRKRDISLHEVIEAIEGAMALTDCVIDDSACHLSADCDMSLGLKKVSQVITQALENVTVSELMPADSKKSIALEIKP
ncbi:SUF system Fe-S cluster assembly regulator [Marinicella rhabdoformis]|uniref:SUF system Fe-S cluster assembly regulator n=1 Tax=Marinicella rhabdoformis TaxID=2580566 RepID=UPI0012AED4B4|nr:SUF system Fe-S cluster assembly regulator [Marinicella rhabdoformis]